MVTHVTLATKNCSLRPSGGGTGDCNIVGHPRSCRGCCRVMGRCADLIVTSKARSMNASCRSVFAGRDGFRVVTGNSPVFRVPFTGRSANGAKCSRKPASAIGRKGALNGGM